MVSKDQARDVLHGELEEFSKKGYSELYKMAEEGAVSKYELQEYQLRIEPNIESNGDIVLLGAIDGPGTKRFWIFSSSVTDILHVSKARQQD